MALKGSKHKQIKQKNSDKQKKNKTANQAIAEQFENPLADRLKIAWFILVGAVTLFFLLSLFSYHVNDPGWTVAFSNKTTENYAGIAGAYTANFILAILGVFGFLLPFLMVYGLWLFFLEKKNFAEGSIFLMLLRILGAFLILGAGSGFSAVCLSVFNVYMPQDSGGILGHQIAYYTVKYLSMPGGIFVFVIAFLLGLTLFSGGFWIRLILRFLLLLGRSFKQLVVSSVSQLKKIIKKKEKAQFKQASDPYHTHENLNPKGLHGLNNAPSLNANLNSDKDKLVEPIIEPEAYFSAPQYDEHSASSFASIKNEVKNKSEKSKQSISKLRRKTDKKTGLPALDLLDNPEQKQETVSKPFLEKMARLVEEKLADFGVQVKVVGTFPGPVITRFEIELAPGVKVSKLSGLAQDLARSLSTTKVRVVEVIPGKPYVGIEIPNQKRQIVRLKEVLSHQKFKSSSSPLTMGLGVDIAGTPETAILGKMPHLLVAGTTGSGKSVGVNAMLISMLYKSTPEELRLIMIDPKMLELSIYEGIPHLLTPVVTDMNEAANALRWCVKEMDRRYELMATAGVRNIAGLNDKIAQTEKTGTLMKDPLWLKLHPGQIPEEAPNLEKLPYIVVIADEFADMIMVVGKKVEELIARLAQKARAAGIHLILATQRPSVDVVTGLIKANIPTRIAFQVSSKIDSRTILDQQGAEQLLGHGDMLYLPPGSGVPNRVHGAFVDDDEVHRVVAAWKEMGEPDYIESITANDTEDSDGEEGCVENQDPLYDEAVKIVIETQRASISNIQRRLRIGYNRSARLIEAMEAAGLVSEMQSNGMREVLVKR